MDKKLRLRIMAPDKTVFDGEAGFVLLRTSGGDMGVLPGHEPFGAQLVRGEVRAFEGQEQIAAFEVRGGFAAIEDDTVSVITGLAGPPEEMQEILAGMERARAQRKEREEAADLEMRRVQEALRRALVHMEVSDDTIRGGREGWFGDDE